MMQHPLISVIIPCYNHAQYLAKAIQSILAQSYKNHEIIVVDDGSTDQTKSIAVTYPEVMYVYQSNQGLSAARNTGIEKSTGSFLVFLDADDWLVPDALRINLSYLLQNPAAACVTGSHKIFYEPGNTSWLMQIDTNEISYSQFLERNFMSMIAAILFQKWVFELYKFDTTLKSCEDYDLHLKVARNYQILSHQEVVAVYRFHGNNMSWNYVTMLETALLVLGRQKSLLKNESEMEWYEKGIIFWKHCYSEKLYYKLISLLHESKKVNKYEVNALKKYNELLYKSYLRERAFTFINKPKKTVKKVVKRFLPNIILRSLSKSPVPKPGTVNLGDFNRTQPFSTSFGYDRGGPVDRYYIENFLQNNAAAISGRILEIGDNEYTIRYGGTNVLQSDILHIDETNLKATFIGDLSDAPHLPDNSFDCIVLTQTLHLIYNYKGAIETCYRILKPKGTLLITVPGISHMDKAGWGKYWLWSFTDNAMKRIMSEFFSPDKTDIQTFGNVLVATAFLYGMGLPELSKQQMDDHDPHYQVIITARAVK